MELYADIIIDISHSDLDRTFQYRVPEQLQQELEPGNVVEIPFGKGNRPTRGYVLRLAEQPSYAPEKIKPITRIVTDLVGAESRLTALALWMRDYYGSTTVQALRTVLPLRQKASPKEKKTVVLKLSGDALQEKLSWFAQKHQKARLRLLEALASEPRLPYDIVTGTLKITPAVLRTMEEQGILTCESEHVYRTPQLIRNLFEQDTAGQCAQQRATIATDIQAVRPDADALSDIRTVRPDADALSDIRTIQPDAAAFSESQDVRPDADVLSGSQAIWSNTVEPSVQSGDAAVPADKQMMRSDRNPHVCPQVTLTGEQQSVVDGICGEWDTNSDGRYLIHGVTGSGKTEVYMELIACALAHGQQAILLIPEISLTYQNVMRFYRRFGDRISILHSRLSPGERYDQFERAKNGDIDIMIGPRSALFTPFPNLGIIIIDEEHETSYRSETVPRYHARETAVRRGALEHAKVVLGSATPSLEAYYGARQGTYRLFTMHARATGGTLPSVHIVDLREELHAGNRSILSRQLRERMEQCLKNHQQMMLFMNRRGYAGFVVCRACGHVMKCPHCDVSLSLHKNGRLVCHYCGYQEAAVQTCPQCGSRFIGGFRAGTQQVEELVAKEFPQARILRMDADTTRGKDGHAAILDAFAKKEADILIGTQMIVKGHDFPEVTLVGILAADLSLHVSDYRAAERTFQLLTQAAGRAGRGNKPGDVVIQTYDPEHYAVTCAAAQEYEPFYEQEIANRSLSGYPPVGGMLAIHCSFTERERLETAAGYLGRFARQAAGRYQVVVLGPVDEPVAKIQDVYRMVLYARGMDQRRLILFKNKLEQYIEMNEGYKEIGIQFEMN